MAASPLYAGDAQTQNNVEFTPPPPPPEPPPEEDRTRSAFSRGTIRLSVLIGSGSSITDNYLILGAGVGYFVLDGLGVGLDYEAWIFGSPVMHRVSPEVKYVLHFVPIIKPYLGAFYRHTFVTDGYDDYEHVGGRGGLFYAPPRSRVYVGGGAVYEHLLDCTDSAFIDCDEVYPEILIGISI